MRESQKAIRNIRMLERRLERASLRHKSMLETINSILVAAPDSTEEKIQRVNSIVESELRKLNKRKNQTQI